MVIFQDHVPHTASRKAIKESPCVLCENKAIKWSLGVCGNDRYLRSEEQSERKLARLCEDNISSTRGLGTDTLVAPVARFVAALRGAASRCACVSNASFLLPATATLSVSLNFTIYRLQSHCSRLHNHTHSKHLHDGNTCNMLLYLSM